VLFVLDSPMLSDSLGMISNLGSKTADKRLRGFLYLPVDLPGSINQPYRFHTFPARQYSAVL